jgi:hypothetical protein
VPSDAALPGAIIAKNQQPGGEWWIRVQSGGIVTFLWDDGGSENSVTSSRTIHDGNWHHVAAVRDANSNELRIYIDGSLDGSKADTTTGSIANTLPITIASFNGTSSRNLTGEIDWISVTSAALAPGGFVADRLVADSDLDSIPDADEIRAVGNLNQLGRGDLDQDGWNDLLEIALNADPASSTSQSTLPLFSSNPFGWTYQRRNDIPWLNYHEEVSRDLHQWQSALMEMNRSIETLDTQIDQIFLAPIEGKPTGRQFLRVKVTSDFP